MQRIIKYLDQYFSQSKYDYRSNNAELYKNERVLIPSTKLISYDQIAQQDHVVSYDFVTIYVGIDPLEKSRLLLRQLVKIDYQGSKDQEIKNFVCLEETTITKGFNQQQPIVQIQLKKLPDDFHLEQKNVDEQLNNVNKQKITDLSRSLGYSLFYISKIQNLIQKDEISENDDVEKENHSALSVIESIIIDKEGENLDHLSSWKKYQTSLLQKRAMSDFLIDRWQREFQ